MAKLKQNGQVTTSTELAELDKSLSYLPTSPAADLLYTVLDGDGIDTLNERKKNINHDTEIVVAAKENRRIVTQRTEKAEVSVELADIERLLSKRGTAKKILLKTLTDANKQALHNGKLGRNYVTCTLQELVDLGIYKSLRTARKGYLNAGDILTSIKVKAKIKRGKNQPTTSDCMEVLFTGFNIKNSVCTIYLNDRINWEAITSYFTLLPTFYFSLSARASDLLYYIFYLARQNTKQIADHGYFNISFRSIQYKLNLPNEKETTHPQRDIKEEIDRAIEEIDNKSGSSFGTEILVEPICNDEAQISDWLDTGYLKVTLDGNFASLFLDIATITAKKIEQSQTRKEKAIERAIMAKELKALEDNTND